ncbi:M1 family aminopeptidase, partial [Micrococcus luteus]|uniref:M1 family aminopeptidase n=1 Tax=Micrococcus luteus TaxID=1270 RepID=UPI00164309B6
MEGPEWWERVCPSGVGRNWMEMRSHGMRVEEMGEMWLGEVVTMEWWEELWVKEWLGEYMGGVGVESVRVRLVGAGGGVG